MITNEQYQSSGIFFTFNFEKILVFKQCWDEFRKRNAILIPINLLKELSKKMGFECPKNLNLLNYNVVWCQKIINEYFKISHSIHNINLIALDKGIQNKLPIFTYEIDAQHVSLYHFTPLPKDLINIIFEYAPNRDINSSFNQIIFKHLNDQMNSSVWSEFLFNVNKLNKIFMNVLKKMDCFIPVAKNEGLSPESLQLSQFFNLRSFFNSVFCDSELSYQILNCFYKKHTQYGMWSEENYIKENIINEDIHIKILNFFIEPLISKLTAHEYLLFVQTLLKEKSDCSLDFRSNQLDINVDGLGSAIATFLPLRKFTSEQVIEYLADLILQNQNKKFSHWEKFNKIETSFGGKRGLYELFLVKITEDYSSKELRKLFIKSYRRMQETVRKDFPLIDLKQEKYQFSLVIDRLLLHLTNQIVAMNMFREDTCEMRRQYLFHFKKIINVLSDSATSETNKNYLEGILFQTNFEFTHWKVQIDSLKKRYDEKFS